MRKSAVTLILLVFGISLMQGQMEERLGDKLFELGEYQKALAQYMQVLEEHPEKASATGLVADCYFQLNQPEQAAEWYRRTLQSEDSGADVHLRYGHCLKFLGHYDQALEQYRKYEKIHPEQAGHFIQSTRFAMEHSVEKTNVNNLAINSDAPDFGAALYEDRLVYSTYQGVRQRPTGLVRVSNRRGAPSQSHLFASQRSEKTGEWIEATQLQSDVRRISNIGPVQYDEHGSMIAFTKNNFRRGVRQVDEKNNNLAIYLAEVRANGLWDRAKAFPHNGMGYSTTTPCFSPDGNTLYFASNMEGGEGGYDIYYSRWDGSNWTEPVNAGTLINSPGNEWVSAVQNEKMFFSSDWHDGFGGMDVFRCNWTDFEASEIENLGYGVNSSRDDYGYTVDFENDMAYFTSNRPGGNGYEDIYSHAIRWESVQAVGSEKKGRRTISTLPAIGSIAMQPLSTGKEALASLNASKGESDDEKQIEEVFSIQIAVYQDKETNVQPFVESLNDIGEVYKLYFDRVIKIRVGNFKEEKAARTALEKVHARGYRDAFVVEEQIVKKVEENEASTSLEEKDDNFYKVRLAAYSNPKWFSPSKVDHLGLISTRKQDGFTIVYLGEYPTIEEAEQTRIKAMDAGYTSAQLVRVNDGDYSVIR